jgi:hypothetical protein
MELPLGKKSAHGDSKQDGRYEQSFALSTLPHVHTP